MTVPFVKDCPIYRDKVLRLFTEANVAGQHLAVPKLGLYQQSLYHLETLSPCYCKAPITRAIWSSKVLVMASPRALELGKLSFNELEILPKLTAPSKRNEWEKIDNVPSWAAWGESGPK